MAGAEHLTVVFKERRHQFARYSGVSVQENEAMVRAQLGLPAGVLLYTLPGANCVDGDTEGEEGERAGVGVPGAAVWSLTSGINEVHVTLKVAPERERAAGALPGAALTVRAGHAAANRKVATPSGVGQNSEYQVPKDYHPLIHKAARPHLVVDAKLRAHPPRAQRLQHARRAAAFPRSQTSP
jgi:hypothetical protein